MKFNPNQRYTRWSIRRLSVGVASVVVASGFFVLVGQPSSVRADVVNPTPGQVLPEETSGTKEGDLSENQETPFSLKRNLRALLEIRIHFRHLQKELK